MTVSSKARLRDSARVHRALTFYTDRISRLCRRKAYFHLILLTADGQLVGDAAAMNLIEQNIADFEARLKRLDAKPNPRRLQSNKLYYELWRDYRQGQLQAMRAGKPFALISTLPRLMVSMGLQCLQSTMVGDRTFGRAMSYMQIARAAGCPSFTCSRVQTGLGVSIAGDLPPIAMMAIDPICEPRTQSMIWLGQQTGIPTFALDVPRERSYRGIRYVADQLREMIAFAEDRVPGVRFDIERLVALQERDERTDRLFAEAVVLRKAKPCPLSGQEGLRSVPLDLVHPKYIDWVESYVEEIRERVAKGIGVVDEEKGRVMWLLAGPFYFDIFAFFEDRQVTVPLYEEGVGVSPGRRIGDDEEYGRHLDPVEEEAARLMAIGFAQTAEWRSQMIVKRCRDFDIDGLVHYNNSGCTPVLGSATIVAERAKAELGIPTLMMEGSCQDEDRLDRKASESVVASFIEVVLANRGKRGTGGHPG